MANDWSEEVDGTEEVEDEGDGLLEDEEELEGFEGVVGGVLGGVGGTGVKSQDVVSEDRVYAESHWIQVQWCAKKMAHVQKKWHHVQKNDPCAKKVTPCEKKDPCAKKWHHVQKNDPCPSNNHS